MEILLLILNLILLIVLSILGTFAWFKINSKIDSSEIEEKLIKINKILEKDKEEQEKIIKTYEKTNDLLVKNNVLVNKQEQYKQFFGLLLDTITEDTEFIRSEFFQRFGNVPEYQQLNSQIVSYSSRIDQIKMALKQYKMMDVYDE